MKRRYQAMAAATAVSLVLAPVAAAAQPGETPRAGLQDRLDDLVATGAVGALAEVRDERGVRRGTSGIAELGSARGVPVGARFRIGSVTKAFVATVVLQLVAERRLRLDDTVEAWLPGAVPNGDDITVRQLLNHTSGVADYLRTLKMPPAPEFLANRWRTWTPAELIERATAAGGTEPGAAFAYSNTNYLLLGQIIQKVTHRPYGQEIDRRIIRPLGLRGTSVPGRSPRIPGPHPHGYVSILQDGRPRLTDYTAMNPSVMGASGEMISTTADLNRFFAALLRGALLPHSLLAEMVTPGTSGGQYGLGLGLRDTPCGVRLYGIAGDALAYQAWSFSTADGRRQITVAFTPNFRGDTDAPAEALLDDVACR